MYEGHSEKYLHINGTWEDPLHYFLLIDKV